MFDAPVAVADPVAGACLSSEARDLHRPRNEERFAAETTPVPLLTLFALKALFFKALNSNNVRGGTCLAEAGGAKKSGSGRDNDRSLRRERAIDLRSRARRA